MILEKGNSMSASKYVGVYLYVLSFFCFYKKHARGFQYSIKDPLADIPRSFKVEGETR